MFTLAFSDGTNHDQLPVRVYAVNYAMSSKFVLPITSEVTSQRGSIARGIYREFDFEGLPKAFLDASIERSDIPLRVEGECHLVLRRSRAHSSPKTSSIVWS